MMNITDLIAQRLIELLQEQDGDIQIGRNDLASSLGCVPSQINYVITSRFTKEQGYIVESRRGGGGYIRIVKLNNTASQLIMHIINSIGYELDEQTARILINTLCLDQRISKEAATLMLCAVAEENFKGAEDGLRKEIRAKLLKAMLIRLA